VSTAAGGSREATGKSNVSHPSFSMALTRLQKIYEARIAIELSLRMFDTPRN
jgi:hypothetical protein